MRLPVLLSRYATRPALTAAPNSLASPRGFSSSRSTMSSADKSTSAWPHQVVYQTRWLDNDQYGHLNNSVYYLIADSITNAYLVNHCGIQPFVHNPPTSAPPAEAPAMASGSAADDVPVESVVALMIANSCRYYSSCEFPRPLLVHLRVSKLGTTSVTWQVGIKEQHAKEEQMAAVITSTHVFVDRHTRRPAKMAPKLRKPLETLLVKDLPQTDSKL